MARSSTGQHLKTWLIGLPLFVAIGLWTVLASLVQIPRRVRALRSAVANELRCPNQHSNAVSGRWECASCKAVYLGWVGKCALCGAGASWFSCGSCGVSIPLPWERPP
jgi:hypothetical protein